MAEVKEKKTMLQKRANDILDICNSFKVVDLQSFGVADNKITEGATLKKSIKEFMAPIVKKQKEAYDEAKKQRDALIIPIDEGTTILARKMATWKKAEDARREGEVRKEQEAAQKIQEQHAIEEAERLEKEGSDKKAVDAVLEMAVEPVPVPVKAVQEVRSKTTIKPKWTFQIINPELVPREFCKPDEVKIRAQLKQTGEATKIAGVRIVEDFAIRKYSE